MSVCDIIRVKRSASCGKVKYSSSVHILRSPWVNWCAKIWGDHAPLGPPSSDSPAHTHSAFLILGRETFLSFCWGAAKSHKTQPSQSQSFQNKAANCTQTSWVHKVQLTMVFCYQNCSDLLWEKIVLVIEKTFEIRGWRPRICKIFEITRTIYSNSERSE